MEMCQCGYKDFRFRVLIFFFYKFWQDSHDLNISKIIMSYTIMLKAKKAVLRPSFCPRGCPFLRDSKYRIYV